ncbi:MAG: hypothetical protein BM485_15315 [Desulfobulbaceae bacterium DB1]|nr:MAG: hypothetical protein BM485_15315 [Desulfobulbaceae bacterium DB1]
MGEGIFCGQIGIVLDNIDSWKAISRLTRNWPAIHQNSPISLCLARQQEQTIIPHLPNEEIPLFRKKPITSLNNNQKNLSFLPEQQVKQKYISFPGKGVTVGHIYCIFRACKPRKSIHYCLIRTLPMEQTHQNKGDGSVLIIDDDKALSRTLHILMENEGYNVETALTAAEGMNRTSHTLPAVTLVDLHLPDGNGLTLLQAMLQVNPAGKFILMSGDSDIKEIISEPRYHGIELLEKPFEIDDVLHRVAQKMMAD